MRPLPEVVLFRRHAWHQWMALASSVLFIPHFYFAYQGYKLNQEWRARRNDTEAPSYPFFPCFCQTTFLIKR